MRYVFLALFVAVSAAHLYASYRSDKRLRSVTKAGILFCLAGYYITSASPISWLLVAALACSLAGDILLIFPHGFAAGGMFFWAAHIFFVLVYAPNIRFSAVPAWLYPLYAAVYGTAAFLELRYLRQYIPKKLFAPMCGYLCANALMNGAALLQLVSRPCAATALIYAGALLFYVSDSVLFFVRFDRSGRRWNHFVVMLTYIAAEFLIVQGVLLLSR